MSAQWFPSAAPVARQARAYFAPVNRVSQDPIPFDPSCQGRFDLNAPPAPWISLGPVQGFTRTNTSKSDAVMTGVPAAALKSVRETLEAEVTFQFVNWTKLTMALATGSQHINILAPANGENLLAMGGQPMPAITVQGGSTSTSIVLAPGVAGMFPTGTVIAIDDDCAGHTGFVGSPICGAYLSQPLSDVDYIRRVTFNLGVVAQVFQDTLMLAEPLAGGSPGANAKLQAVCGFIDRLGGSFFQEWSGLFVVEGSQGERVLFHYPRLVPVKDGEESSIPLNGPGKGSLDRVLLKAHFRALPVTDPVDGERVLCYRSFLPAPPALG